MGTVFLAERADDTFARRVAIKVLRGIPTRESTERMRRERQILADLSHPHIARLLDGGSTADGQPYLVMEYVEGEPINAFCRRTRSRSSDRLRLIQKVAGAVQYAHQRLVIHRDLKPANVLVRADGEPVLLDFGIAKLLGNTGGDAATGLPWFTPAYASPEQRRGEAVSTATDVHGLGLLLYECLAERPPAADPAERLPAPSATTTRYRIPVELDLIVAKATHAEPERRYVSAAALADDLQRYLRGRPVNAAPDRLHYRVAKFVGRHRLAAAAIAAAMVMAILFTWRLANERDRALRAEAEARQQSATAERVVDYLVSLFHSASPDEAGTKPIAPRELVDRGRKEIDTRLAGSPVQQARLLGAIGKIYLEIGAPEAAAESLGAAAELERTHGTPARRAAYLADQGYAYNIAEQPAAAEPVLREGLAELEKAPDTDPKAMADALSTLALAQARNGNPQAALATLQRALDYARQSDGGEGIRVGQSLYALAEVQMRAGKLDDAETNAKRSIELLRAKTSEGSPEVHLGDRLPDRSLRAAGPLRRRRSAAATDARDAPEDARAGQRLGDHRAQQSRAGDPAAGPHRRGDGAASRKRRIPSRRRAARHGELLHLAQQPREPARAGRRLRQLDRDCSTKRSSAPSCTRAIRTCRRTGRT